MAIVVDWKSAEIRVFLVNNTIRNSSQVWCFIMVSRKTEGSKENTGGSYKESVFGVLCINRCHSDKYMCTKRGVLG